MKKISLFPLLLKFVPVLLIVACAKPQSLPSRDGGVCSDNESSKPSNPSQLSCVHYWEQLKLCMEWAWMVRPTATQKGSLLLKMVRPHRVDQSPVLHDLEFDLKATLWMPSMGHGSVPTRIQKVDVGSWLVENIYFNMPGDWEIRLAWWHNGHIKDEYVLRFDIVW